MQCYEARRITPIVLLFFFSNVFLARPQSTYDTYRNSELFSEHLNEAYSVHKELIDGEIGETLRKFIADSIDENPKRKKNKTFIDEALNAEVFRRHTTRIDTQTTLGSFPFKYMTEIAFRDIHYLGNSKFLRYRLYVGFRWNTELKTVKRYVSFNTMIVDSRKNWDRKAWDNVTYEEMLKHLQLDE